MLAVVIQRAPDGSFLQETARSYEIHRPDEDQGDSLMTEFAKWAAQRIYEERAGMRSAQE